MLEYIFNNNFALLYVTANILIGLSAFSIGAASFYFQLKRPKVPQRWVFYALALWYFGLGTGRIVKTFIHLQPQLLIVELPIDVFTASLSLIAGVAIWPFMVSGLKLRQQLERNSEEIRYTKQLFESFINYAPMIAWIKDYEGKYVFINKLFAQVFDCKPEDVYGKTDFDLFPDKLAKTYRTNDIRVLTTQEKLTVEEEVTLADGTRRDMLSMKFPVRDQHDQVSVAGVALDITEQKQSAKEKEELNRSLERARDQAIAASRFKSQFIANISHELRTPLNGVIGFTDRLACERLTIGQKEMADTIRSQADILLTTVNDLLDFTSLEEGNESLELTNVDILETIEEVCEFHSQEATNKKLSLTAYLSPEVPRVILTDPMKLRAVMTKLVDNALKNTDKGEILVTATLEHTGTNKVIIKFTVSDTGKGLSEEQLSHLFEPFIRVGESRQTTAHTGLGLAICQRYLTLLGSRLSVQSSPNQGSIFSFSINAEPAKLQKPFSWPRSQWANTRVLLIGKSPSSNRVVENYLRYAGVTCDATHTTKSALELLASPDKECSYNIAIVAPPLDLDPLEFVNAIHSQCEGMKVIFLDNYQNPQLAKQLLNEGCIAYLYKPLRETSLFETLKISLKITQPSKQDVDETQQVKPILIVEDNPVNQRVALFQLKHFGLSADVVNDGVEAVQAVAKKDYAFILMDLQMPRMDGYEATKRIRTNEALTGKHIPIIAYTAHSLESDRQRCLGVGMDEFVTKPVSKEKLSELFANFLPNMVLQQSAASAAQNTLEQESQIIDWNILRETFGDRELPLVLNLVITSSQDVLQRIHDGITNEDLKQIYNAAHELKGSALSIGSHYMADAASALENAAEANSSWTEIKTMYIGLAKAFQQVKTSIVSTTHASK